MKHFKFSRLFAAALFVAVFGLSGCAPEVVVVPYEVQVEKPVGTVYITPIEANDGLIGDWVDSLGSHYKITQSDFDNFGTGWTSYAGNSLLVQKLTDTSGTIFIKYTRAADASWNYTTTAPDVGKWYAISYKDLTSSSIKISGAFKAGGKTSCATLKEAVEEFTVANRYYATYTDCTK